MPLAPGVFVVSILLTHTEGCNKCVNKERDKDKTDKRVGKCPHTVRLLEDPYNKGVQLPRIPRYHVPFRDDLLPQTDVAASGWQCTTAHGPRVAPSTRLSLIKGVIRHLHYRLINI